MPPSSPQSPSVAHPSAAPSSNTAPLASQAIPKKPAFDEEAHHTASMRWGAFALFTSIFLMVSKLSAYFYTGSTSILSDALESVANIATSGFTLYAVWLTLKPHDQGHPYGHGKVEYFSTGIEGLFIGGAGIAIMIVATPRFFTPVPIDNPGEGAIIALVIAVITWIAGGAIVRAGKRLNARSIASDGKHIQADGITTMGVFVALILVKFTGIVWIDPLVALIISAWLLVTGGKMLREAIRGLMDEADPELLDEIGGALQELRRPGWVAPHHGKVHHLGPSIHLDLHLVFPRYWTLEHTHEETRVIEESLCERFGPRTQLMIHMEACTDISCSYCDVEECPIRKAPFKALHTWTGEYIAQTRRPRPDETPPTP